MANDPYEVLLEECPKVVTDAIGNNDHIGSFVYTVLCQIVIQAAKNTHDIRGIVPQVSLFGDAQIKIDLEYKLKGTDFATRKLLFEINPEIVKCMKANRKILELPGAIVEVLMGWAATKEITLKDLIVEKAMIPRGATCIVANLVTKAELSERFEHEDLGEEYESKDELLYDSRTSLS